MNCTVEESRRSSTLYIWDPEIERAASCVIPMDFCYPDKIIMKVWGTNIVKNLVSMAYAKKFDPIINRQVPILGAFIMTNMGPGIPICDETHNFVLSCLKLICKIRLQARKPRTGIIIK